MRIFIAAPFFNLAEREFNSKLAQILRNLEFVEEVWLAQEHELLQQPEHELKLKIFQQDLDALRRSDVIIAILDGECIDSGTAFELGYGYALGKQLIGIKTDSRWFSQLEELNLMIQVPLLKLIRSWDLAQLEQELSSILRELAGKSGSRC